VSVSVSNSDIDWTAFLLREDNSPSLFSRLEVNLLMSFINSANNSSMKRSWWEAPNSYKERMAINM